MNELLLAPIDLTPDFASFLNIDDLIDASQLNAQTERYTGNIPRHTSLKEQPHSEPCGPPKVLSIISLLTLLLAKLIILQNKFTSPSSML